MQTTEEQIALERFKQGEEVEALAEFDRLRATQARGVANLALTAWARGKITMGAVIELGAAVRRIGVMSHRAFFKGSRLGRAGSQTPG